MTSRPTIVFAPLLSRPVFTCSRARCRVTMWSQGGGETRAPLDLLAISGNYLVLLITRIVTLLDSGRCCRPPERFRIDAMRGVASRRPTGPCRGPRETAVCPPGYAVALRCLLIFSPRVTLWLFVNLTLGAQSECQRFGPPSIGRIPLGFPRSNPALPIP